MADLINNLLLNETAPTSVAKTPTAEQGVKESPSLFDSLLLANSPKEETAAENKVVSADSKVEEVKTAVDPKEVKTDTAKVEENVKSDVVVEPKVEEVSVPQDKTTQTTTSLLDRLVIEAKNDVKDAKAEELNNKINNSILETKVEEVKIAADVKEVKLDNVKVETDNKLEVKTEEKKSDEVDNKVATATTSSLLDKLIVDAKNAIESDTKEVKTDTTKVEENKSGIVAPKTEEVSVITDKTPTTQQTGSLLDKLIANAKDTLAVDPKEIKTDITKVEENVKSDVVSVVPKAEEVTVPQDKTTQTTTSLLDRLVLEAKNDVKDAKAEELNNKINNSILETKVEEVKIAADIKEVDNKLEVKIEEKKSVVAKETAITTSLLDKLVVDAKNNIKEAIQEDKLNTNPSILMDDAIVANTLDDSTENKSLGNIITNTTEEVISSVVVLEATTVDKVEVITTTKTEEKLSLMDKLIQKNSEKVTLETVETVVSNNQEIPLKENAKDLISNIYLGSQKNQLNNQTLFNKKEAITILKEGNSVQAVKTSAEILGLGLEDIDVQQTVEDKIDLKKSNIQIDDKKNLIDTLLSKKNIKNDDIKNLITTSVEASKALVDNTLNLAADATVNVNSPLSYNIQSKIIGAKQQMATMMSDIARQMYDSYKAPVTAFRINLNPQDLGSIAILMKSDKNSGLSISMNVSNSVTLDTLVENQNVLKNSLNKTFSDNTKFNLDFNSSNENNSNQSSSNQSGQGNNRNNQQQMATQSILQLQEENKDREEKVIDYM